MKYTALLLALVLSGCSVYKVPNEVYDTPDAIFKIDRNRKWSAFTKIDEKFYTAQVPFGEGMMSVPVPSDSTQIETIEVTYKKLKK